MAIVQNLDATNRDRLPPRTIVVLAVDDLPIRAAYAYSLSAEGFDVRVIDDSAPPIAGTAAWPDVIVVDVRPGSRYGWAFVQWFRSEDRAGDVPVIAVTSVADDDTRALARRNGCAAVCAKTCPPGVLSSGIRAVLDFRASSPR